VKAEDGKPSPCCRRLHAFRASQARLRRCHDTSLTVKHPRNPLGAVKPQVCQECHADEFKAIAGSIHGRRAAGDRAIKDCTGCHDSLHRVLKGGDPASSLSPVNQIKTCGACHEEMMANYERSEHARGLLKSGLVEGSPSCSSCHGKHDIHPKSDAAAPTNHARSSRPAASATAGFFVNGRTAHGALWKNGNGGNHGQRGAGVLRAATSRMHQAPGYRRRAARSLTVRQLPRVVDASFTTAFMASTARSIT
jgi:hypothetical protein